MPIQDKEERNAYMREYMLKRYHARIKLALEKLGGKCVKCGSDRELDLDHIDPATKSFSLASKWSVSEEKFWNEVDKCQVLCKPCHSSKSILERGMVETKGKEVHGTLSSYRYCKCDACKSAKSDYNRKYKLNRKAGAPES